MRRIGQPDQPRRLHVVAVLSFDQGRAPHVPAYCTQPVSKDATAQHAIASAPWPSGSENHLPPRR